MQEIWVQSSVGKIPWRRKSLHTPVFWLGEFHGLYSPWGHKESDTTDWLSLTRYVNFTMLSISLNIKRKCINATVSQNVINYSQTFGFFLFCFWRLKNVLFRNVAIIFYKGFHLFAFHIKDSVKWEKKKKNSKKTCYYLLLIFPSSGNFPLFQYFS